MLLPFISILIVSIISLIGILLYLINKKSIKTMANLLIALSIGTLLGDSFIHIIPELNLKNSIWPSINIVIGILLFFIIEKIIHWHHCNQEENTSNHKHTTNQHSLNKNLIIINLIGDSLHNLLDGIAITSTFLVSTKLGIITTIAIILHEIPQEIGDFGLLLYAGLKPKKALFLNFLSAIISLLGIPITLLLSNNVNVLNNVLLPFAGASFIYIAMSDLIPELHKQNHKKPVSRQENSPKYNTIYIVKKQISEIILILIGITFMALLKIYGG